MSPYQQASIGPLYSQVFDTMPLNPRRKRGKEIYLHTLQKKEEKRVPEVEESCDAVPQFVDTQPSTSQAPSLSSGEKSGVFEAEEGQEYREGVKSKVEERNCLITSVSTYAAKHDPGSEDSSANVAISESRLRDLAEVLPVWCGNCNIPCHNLHFKHKGADVDVEVVCVYPVGMWCTVIPQN